MIASGRYHTQSGSVYEVSFAMGIVAHEYRVRRVTLGEGHAKLGPHQLAKRKADGLDAWRTVQEATCAGVGSILKIVLHNGNGGTLYTSPVVRIEVL